MPINSQFLAQMFSKTVEYVFLLNIAYYFKKKFYNIVALVFHFCLLLL